MKKSVMLTMLFLSGTLLAATVHQASDDASRAQSLLKDGTFNVEKKQNLFGKWLVNFRILEQNPELVILDKSNFLKEGQSIRLSNPKGPNVGLMQTISGIKPATKYRISYYLKYQNVVPDKADAFGGVVANVWHGGNRWFPTNAFTGSSDWKRHEFFYTTPAGSKPELTFSLMIINAKGTAWFDDVQVVEVK